MSEEGADDLVVVQVAIWPGVVPHHAFGGLDSGFGSAIALRVVGGREPVADAPAFEESSGFARGEFRAAVARQLNWYAFGAEERAQTGDQAFGARGRGTIYVNPS